MKKTTKTDKAIVAFLVSMGVFSCSIATKYVKSLTEPQKISLYSLAKKNSNNLLICSTGDPAAIHNDGNTESRKG